MRTRTRQLIIIALVAAGILAIASLFLVKIDHQIKGRGRLVADTVWTLSHIEQDKIKAELEQNGLDKKYRFSLFHFNRPDVVNFHIKPGLDIGSFLEAGTRVAEISSYIDENRVAELKGQLSQAKARLSALQTGAKPALVEQAEQQLEYAKTQLRTFEPQLQRQKKLHQQNLVSDQQLELAQAQYEIYEDNVDLAQARLQAVRTGEKSENIQIEKAQIESLQNQIEILQKKIDAKTLSSPIAGLIVQPSSLKSELLKVCHIDTMVAQFPVKESDIKNVHVGQKFSLHVFSTGALKKATVSGISQQTQMINNQPMFMVIALIENADHQILPGTTGAMRITTGRVSLAELIYRAWLNFQWNK